MCNVWLFLFVCVHVPWMSRSKFAIVDACSLLYSVRCVRCVVRGVGNGGCVGIGLVRWLSVVLRLVASLFLRARLFVLVIPSIC